MVDSGVSDGRTGGPRWFVVKSAVAMVMAITVLVAMLPGTLSSILGMERSTATAEEVQLWRDVLMVLIGALAGYIGGSNLK